jgi:hypothetical protein
MSAALAHLHVAATLIIIAWDVWLTNRIAGARMLPRRFVGITGLAGLLLIPAVIVALATGSLEYGRALAAVAWLWPATLVLFAVQAWYATLRGFVTPAMGVPIALYDSLIAGAALVQLVVRWGVQPPSIFLAVLAADYGALAATASPLALSSSLLFYVPLFAPAFPARYRASATVRVLLAAAAAVWGGIIIAKIWPASGAVRGYDRYDAVRMRERPDGDLAIGVKLFPQLHAGPPPVAIREDLELVDSLTPDVIAVTIAPDGVKRATLDSIAHVLEPVRRDSTVFVVTLGNGALPLVPGRFSPLEVERRVELVRTIARRLRPDYLLPVAEPYGRASAVYGRLPVTTWTRYLARAAAAARQVSPRTRVSWAAARYDARDSALFAWSAAPGSPIDALGFAVSPSDQGARGLDADMFAADRFIRATRSPKEHWVWSAASFPSAHGEHSQERALWAVLSWASSRPAIRGVIVAEAGDYDTTIGLRAANRRLRPAVATVARAIAALKESEAR